MIMKRNLREIVVINSKLVALVERIVAIARRVSK